jgi:hypothetical protein
MNHQNDEPKYRRKPEKLLIGLFLMLIKINHEQVEIDHN